MTVQSAESKTSRSQATTSRNSSSPARTKELRAQAAVVREDVRELAEVAGEAAMEKLDPIQEYVREKPMKSLLIAAGVGAVFGCLFLRR